MNKIVNMAMLLFFLTGLTLAQEPDKIVEVGKNLQLSATASDKDCHFEAGKCSHLETDDAITVTWSATAGSFPNGNTGKSVTWKAPDSAGDVTVTAAASNSGSAKAVDSGASDSILVRVVLECAGCCESCADKECKSDMVCVDNGTTQTCNCVGQSCLDGKCESIGVYITNVAPSVDPLVNHSVVFTAVTILSGYEGKIEWSGGGSPATGSGASFTTSWSQPGTYTVTASITDCFGFSAGSDSRSVTVGYSCTAIENMDDWQECKDSSTEYLDQNNRAHEIDGCSIHAALAGAIGAYSQDNPTGCLDPNSSFYNPCKTHDECYQTCDSDKEGIGGCDETLLSGSYSVCMAMLSTGVCNTPGDGMSSNDWFSRCTDYSYDYFYGVWFLGDWAWEERQVDYCECCLN